jgi:hypothetical protein
MCVGDTSYPLTHTLLSKVHGNARYGFVENDNREVEISNQFSSSTPYKKNKQFKIMEMKQHSNLLCEFGAVEITDQAILFSSNSNSTFCLFFFYT